MANPPFLCQLSISEVFCILVTILTVFGIRDNLIGHLRFVCGCHLHLQDNSRSAFGHPLNPPPSPTRFTYYPTQSPQSPTLTLCNLWPGFKFLA